MSQNAHFVKLVLQVLCLGSFMILTTIAGPAEGQETAAAQAVPAEQQLAGEQTQGPADFISAIREEWELTRNAIAGDRLKEAGERLAKIEELKIQAGIKGLEENSLYLLDQASKKLGASDTATAAFFVRSAIRLSPDSPLILARSAPLFRSTGLGSLGRQLTLALRNLWHRPDIALRFADVVAYPVLCALTLAVYSVFIFFFAYHARELLTVIARGFPPGARGIGAPILGLLLIAAPLPFGPLWALAVWPFALLLLLARKRSLVFAAGTVIALWGFVVPLRENLAVWLHDDGVQRMLRAAAGSFSAGDHAAIKQLLQSRPNDPAVHYVLGEIERKLGDYGASDAAFARAESILGAQPWTLAQRGSLAFLRGQTDKAQSMYERAEELGLDSAAFYFNYSKIKFELLETDKSRELFKRAVEKDQRLTESLQAREEKLGLRSGLALAEIDLPFRMMMHSALIPSERTALNGVRLAKRLMAGVPARLVGVLGLLVMALVLFFPRAKRRERLGVKSYFPGYRIPASFLLLLHLIPGAAWIRAGRPGTAFALLALICLLALPLLGWPAGVAGLLNFVPGARVWYGAALAAAIVTIDSIGFYLKEE